MANPFVMGHFNTLYCRRALVSVRAMVDPNNDSDSLLTLLTDIAAHPADLETTDSEMRLPGTDTIDRDKVRADIERLKTVAATTKKYVSKRIAHIGGKGTPTVPTALEIDAAVELIGELLHKYTLLLTGADLRLPGPVGAVVAGTQGARVRCCSDCCLSDVMTKIIERVTLIRRGSWSLTVKLQIAHMALALPPAHAAREAMTGWRSCPRRCRSACVAGREPDQAGHE